MIKRKSFFQKNTVVTYLNKKGEKSTYYFDDVMDNGDIEINKRLKYTKEIFLHFLSKSKKKRKIIHEILGNAQSDDNEKKK